MLKKHLAVLMALGLTAALLSGCRKEQEPAPETAVEPVRIGVLEPETGTLAPWGQLELLGLHYANEQRPSVTLNGVEYPVELVCADNASDPDKTSASAQTLADAGVSIVLGSYDSALSLAAADTLAEAGIPALGISCTSPQLTEESPHYFTLCYQDAFQGTVLANFAAHQLNARRVYCLAETGSVYDLGLVDTFRAAAEPLGLTVVEAEFPSGTTNFADYLAQAREGQADVIFAPCTSTYAPSLLAQLGDDMPLLSGDSWDSEETRQAAAAGQATIYLSTFYAEGGDPDFEDGFRDWLHEHDPETDKDELSVSALSVLAYDAYNAALSAIEAAGSADPADVERALHTVSCTGVTGTISFGDNGSDQRDTAYIKTVNLETGDWELVAIQGIG